MGDIIKIQQVRNSQAAKPASLNKVEPKVSPPYWCQNQPAPKSPYHQCELSSLIMNHKRGILAFQKAPERYFHLIDPSLPEIFGGFNQMLRSFFKNILKQLTDFSLCFIEQKLSRNTKIQSRWRGYFYSNQLRNQPLRVQWDFWIRFHLPHLSGALLAFNTTRSQCHIRQAVLFFTYPLRSKKTLLPL